VRNWRNIVWLCGPWLCLVSQSYARSGDVKYCEIVSGTAYLIMWCSSALQG